MDDDEDEELGDGSEINDGTNNDQKPNDATQEDMINNDDGK